MCVCFPSGTTKKNHMKGNVEENKVNIFTYSPDIEYKHRRRS